MKLNTQAFPYPVLTNEEGSAADYEDCAFQCNLMFDNEISENGDLIIDYLFQISNEEIEKLVENKNATFAIDLSCPDTLKREMFLLERNGQLIINAFELYGKVDFTPLIIVRKLVEGFTSKDFNPEFGGSTFDLQIGDIIAIDDTLVKYFEFNNQSFDSLVKTRMSAEIEPFSYQIEPTQNFIYITMGTEMHKLFKEVNETKNKGILGMSIYKDVLFLAIQDLIENEESENQQWARSFKSRLSELGFELPDEPEFNKINLFAQKFVHEIGVKKLFKDLKLGA